jgi:hypothetical protein
MFVRLLGLFLPTVWALAWTRAVALAAPRSILFFARTFTPSTPTPLRCTPRGSFLLACLGQVHLLNSRDQSKGFPRGSGVHGFNQNLHKILGKAVMLTVLVCRHKVLGKDVQGTAVVLRVTWDENVIHQDGDTKVSLSLPNIYPCEKLKVPVSFSGDSLPCAFQSDLSRNGGCISFWLFVLYL